MYKSGFFVVVCYIYYNSKKKKIKKNSYCFQTPAVFTSKKLYKWYLTKKLDMKKGVWGPTQQGIEQPCESWARWLC